MSFSASQLGRLKPFCVPVCLLTGALMAVAMAFPAVARWVLAFEAPMAHRLFPTLGVLLGGVLLCGCFQWQVVRDCCRRRWGAMLFHLGGLCILIGGGLTAICARTESLPMALPPSEPMVRVGEGQWMPLDEVAAEPYMLSEWRLVFVQGRWLPLYPHTKEYFHPADFRQWAVAEQWRAGSGDVLLPGTGEEWTQRAIAHDRVTLEDFQTETYPNGMPSQYRTHVRFNDDEHHTLSVNAPLRRKGLTYYQMSTYTRYVPAVDAYGMPVYFKSLELDEQHHPRFDEAGRPRYRGEAGEMPVEYRMTFTELAVRSDPGAPVTFVGYGLLVLAALGLALREERRA